MVEDSEEKKDRRGLRGVPGEPPPPPRNLRRARVDDRRASEGKRKTRRRANGDITRKDRENIERRRRAAERLEQRDHKTGTRRARLLRRKRLPYRNVEKHAALVARTAKIEDLEVMWGKAFKALREHYITEELRYLHMLIDLGPPPLFPME